MKTKFNKKIGRSIEETILRRQFDSLNPTTWPDGNHKIQSIGSAGGGGGNSGGGGIIGTTDPRVLESLHLKEKNKNISSRSSSRMNTSSSGGVIGGYGGDVHTHTDHLHENLSLKEKELNEMYLSNVFNDYNEQDKVNIMESLVKYTRQLQSRVNQLEATVAMNTMNNAMTYQTDIAYDESATNGYGGGSNINDSYNNNDGGIRFINNNNNNNSNSNHHLRPITKFAIKKDLRYSEKDKIFMNQTALSAINSTNINANSYSIDGSMNDVLNDQDVTAIHSIADQVQSLRHQQNQQQYNTSSGGRRGAVIRDSFNSNSQLTPQGEKVVMVMMMMVDNVSKKMVNKKPADDDDDDDDDGGHDDGDNDDDGGGHDDDDND